MVVNKKSTQLGMNYSTASHRLLKDILWNFILESNRDICCKCGLHMTRETFSIEHIIPWLDSDNPIELFFSLENISFSHLRCNIGTARRPNKLSLDDRVENRRRSDRESKKRNYCPAKRKEKYQLKGH